MDDDKVMRVEGLPEGGFGSPLAEHGRRARAVRSERIVVSSLLPLVLLGACFVLTGCGDQVRTPFPEEVADFEAAGQTGPAIDLERLVRARIPSGPYRVVPGDVLELEMPRVLDPQLLDAPPPAGGRESFRLRIGGDGTVVLPVIGPFPVAGSSLAEIESAVMAEYYPKYVKTRLPIYVSVLEYKTYRVSVVGAVARMGIYSLRHDQMSLVTLLMEAGGIVDDGAAVIRIVRQDQQDNWSASGSDVAAPPDSGATVVLPVKGLNVPAADVALRPGDSVVVERPTVQNIVVLGLVARPGSFPYPPAAQYNVAQALGLAGGLDPIAEPRYVSVYRLTAEGAVVSITLQLVNPGGRAQLTEALALALKPGDVLSVEHTPRTRTNVFFDRVFRISLGLYMTPDDFSDDDG